MLTFHSNSPKLAELIGPDHVAQQRPGDVDGHLHRKPGGCRATAEVDCDVAGGRLLAESRQHDWEGAGKRDDRGAGRAESLSQLETAQGLDFARA